MALLRKGHLDINTEDPALINQAVADLKELYDICNIKVGDIQYQSVPEGTSWLNQAWSGDMIAGYIYYLPKGTPATALAYWKADKGKVPVQNDCFSICSTTKKPVLSHLFLNYLLDNGVAYSNFVNFNGYQPPLNEIDPESLVKDGVVPENLANSVLTKDDFGPDSSAGDDPDRHRPAALGGRILRLPGRRRRLAPTVYRRWLWPSLSLPGVLWLIVLFVVPFYAVLAVSLGTVDPILFQPVPIWNPLEWNVGWLQEALQRLAPGGIWFDVGIRTIVYVVLSLALCLLIGYPVAYYTARHAGRWKGLILILIILPLWISYMMRMLAWVNLLQADGYINRFLMFTHVLSQPRDWLGGSSSTVIFALVYGYIPYLILPLFASLDRIERSHVEAARDLGASPWSAFRTVTLPLSKTGILGGAVLITLPMFGDYYTPNIVSMSPKTSMIGNQIDLYFHGGPQPTLGAALTIILAVFLTFLMAYYMWSIHRAQRDVGAVGAV